MEKDLFITTVPLIEVDGSTNIPTVLYYRKGKEALFGEAAFYEVKDRTKINEDFKVDIGNIDPSSLRDYKRFITAAGQKISAIQLTADFMRQVLQNVQKWFELQGITKPTNIMISEPLSLQSETAPKEWLSRYRSNIKKTLSGELYGFENISFLPEPFAVFQYYRYGFKHPVLSQQTKHNALVLDFGGGTFDVCVIETTKEGDIREGGKHSKPLAASSIPVGGYYINKVLAEHLIKKYLIKNIPNKKIRTANKFYHEWRKGEKDFTDFEDLQNFIQNFHNLIYELENAKIALCKSISNWDLEEIPKVAIPIVVPSNPFTHSGQKIDGKITAFDFYNIFLKNIWNPHLKPNIHRALKRAKEELKSGKISVVLLSGGSANIGWLNKLLLKDFYDELHNIEIFPLPNYQEVVAQGLAIECARTFYTKGKQGDFSSITYNRICLVMNPDEDGYQVKSFKNRTKELPNVQNNPGVLLPSASLLKKYFEKPMRWRVKLSRRPSKKLQYRFMRSSFDPSDLENVLNIENFTIFTPPNTKFDSSLQVELIVKENGTAYPKFIYKTGPNDQVVDFKQGDPFPIDLTTLQCAAGTAVIGFDFGTSNSSVSFVDERSIRTYNKRKRESGWEDLATLVEKLPYPISVSLAKYLSQLDSALIAKNALDLMEDAFTLISYITYLEFCVYKGRKESRKFKGFTQRSIGPLLGFFRECIADIPESSIFSNGFKEILNNENINLISDCASKLTKHKHGKTDSSKINHVLPIQIICNICSRVFEKNIFGFFEQVKKQKFTKEYSGRFRKAHGRLPFIETFEYIGQDSYSEDQPLLLNIETGKILFLQPLIFWDECDMHSNIAEGHCYFFDKFDHKRNLFSFKAGGFNCSCDISEGNQYAPLAELLNDMLERDCETEICEAGNFKKIEFF